MHSKPNKALRDDVARWMQQPVYVVLNDGSFYAGWITDVNEEAFTLSGQKGKGKLKKTSIDQLDKMKTSAFIPDNIAFNSLQDGGWADPFAFAPAREGPTAAGGAGWGGLGGFMGFVKQVWPPIQIGMGIVRAVMPLMGGLKL
jgi:hypothetical protein